MGKDVLGMEGIAKNTGVLGGDARIAGTRVAVWMIEAYRQLSWTDAQILTNFPSLKISDLENSRVYAATHGFEIDRAIREHDDA